MEELKKNADAALFKQRTDEIHKYLVYLIDETLRLGTWSMRCSLLELFSFIGYWVIWVVAIFGDVPDEFRRTMLDFAFLVLLVAMFRGAYHYRKWREAEGEWRGATNVLRKMGVPLPEEGDGDRKIKTTPERSPFRRFKEFIERMNSKDKMEAYA